MSESAAASQSDDRPSPSVDNATLAFMLRESADIVEKGEFDVILYHALQDFRTYYKLHLPRRKEKTKKTPVIATTTAAAPADSVENSSEAAATSSSESPNEANTKPAETTGEATAPPACADPSSKSTLVEPKPMSPARGTSAGAAAVSGTASTTPSTTDPTMSSSKLKVDAPASAAAEPRATENPISTQSARMDSVGSVLDSGRSVEDFDNEASLRDAQAKQNHFTPFGKKAKNSGSKISTGMFATKNKLKLPKIHVNLPSSVKKKRESELANVTGGDVATYAESSRRRAAPDDNEYHYDGEMQLPQRSTKLQPAVTGFAKADTYSTSANTPVDRVGEDEPADAEIEKPSSLRNNETDNANNTSVTEPTAPTASVPATAPAPEEFVADPRPESFEYEMPEHGHSKPAFQRPKNKSSAVVANGWIEQQRRSKMRTVWKEVLASLVQGRRPGEETTLWIQREIVDPATGRKELEALHQVPIKLLEHVVYSEYTTDDRFSLKIFNSHEEFVFRCNNDPSAAMNWVTILQQFEMESKQNGNIPTATKESLFPDFPEEKKGADMPERPSSPNPARMAIRDLRAICHGAGINTVGMERADLERNAAEVQKRGTYFAPPSGSHAAAASITTAGAPPVGGVAGPATNSRSASPLPPKPTEPSAPVSNGVTATKMSIMDLRAICHGAGISTVGMERGELERAAAEVQKRGTYFAPQGATPPVAPRPAADTNPEDEAAKQEEIRRRQAAEDEARRRAAEEVHWRRHEEETLRRAAEDEHRRRAEEDHRRRLAEEEHRRRMAEQQARQAEDQRRRYAEQQAAWHHQQQQEEQRRRIAEQQAAEQRRLHEEAIRKQQQWAGQQPHHQQQGWAQHHHPQPHHPQQPQQPHAQRHQQQWPQQQQQWHQQQQHYQQAAPQGPPPQQHPPQQQSKYAKMANQTEDYGQVAITKLKHDILIQWALQPPQMQMLRSVDILLSTIQTVFPPALGVPAHDYFTKWKVVTRESVLSDVGIIDEEKVKKAVRKLRFFLHPDKLPKDLNKEQEFMVKMLWDITNDAWEEYEKSKADLDWVK